MRNKYDEKDSGRENKEGYVSGKFKKKVCKFCSKQLPELTYKDYDKLARFITYRGKISSSRSSGNCAKHQRLVAREIKRARLLALLPFVKE